MWSFHLVSNIAARALGLTLHMAATPALPQDYLRPLEPERVWLAAHNIAREEVGLEPLRWNPALARDAEDWAITLAKRRVFQHAPYDVRKGQGENLWQGTRDRYSPWQMISAFVAEKRDFRPGTFPDVSYTGRWSDVGHYTQIIWPETQEVGCAVASNQRDDVLVCRYWPAGNVMGFPLEPNPHLSRR